MDRVELMAEAISNPRKYVARKTGESFPKWAARAILHALAQDGWYVAADDKPAPKKPDEPLADWVRHCKYCGLNEGAIAAPCMTEGRFGQHDIVPGEGYG